MRAEEVSVPKCDVCGRFVSFDSICEGLARHVMLTPDSDRSSEEFETLCEVHNVAENRIKQ